jgi:glycosyltransferase involved in cell wall biosynthesis
MGLPIGGSEIQLYLLARSLADEGYKVTLYVADMGQGPQVADEIHLEPLLPLANGLRLRPRDFPPALVKLARARHRLYITQGPSPVNGLACVAARLARGRHMHMCAHDDEASGLADVTLSRPAKWLHHFGLRHAHAVTCQNDRQKSSLKKIFARRGLVVSSLPPVFGPQATHRDGDFLWVGRDIEWKQPELFIELARHMPAYRFTMLFQPQPGRDSSRLGSQAPPNLTLIPGLPLKDAAALFSRYRVLVCTSSSEGFPNTFLLAAFAGTPILSLSVDPDGLVTRFGAGLVCDGTIQSLEHNAGEIAENALLWESLHKGALRYAEDQRKRGRRVVNLVHYLMTSPSISADGMSGCSSETTIPPPQG